MAELTYPHDEFEPEAGTGFQVAEGVWWMRLPLPFSLTHINCWLIEDGDSWAVVDTGIKSDDSRKLWEQAFETVLGGRPVSRVFVTHEHPDHVGQAGYLCDRFDAPLCMTRAEYFFSRTFSAEIHRDGMPKQAQQYYSRAGLPAENLQELAKRGFGGYAKGVTPLPPGFFRLKDGMRLRIGGREWQVIVGAGHSPEHACLYCPALDVLISGDQVLPKITSNVSVHATEPEENPLGVWMDSHEKFLANLPDSVLVCPAHGRPFYGLHARLRELMNHHEDRMLAIEENCIEPKRAHDLLPILFKRKLDTFQTMMALGEAVAHLHLLMERERIERTLHEDGVYRYRSIDPSLAMRSHPDRHEEPDDEPIMV